MALETFMTSRTQLLLWEIDRYRGVLAGVTETHRWTDKNGAVFEDVHLPDGVQINMATEQQVIDTIRGIHGVEEAMYQGPITNEQALGAIMLRREAMMVENGPLSIARGLL